MPIPHNDYAYGLGQTGLSNALLNQQRKAAYEAAQLYGCTTAGLMNRQLGQILKPFPRSERERTDIWERRVYRIKEKRWERRRQLLGEAAWRIGLVWGGLGAIVLTAALINLTVRLLLG